MNEELKPCPFCGKPGEVFWKKTTDRYVVWCPSCRSEGAYDLGESGAIESWNTRPIEDALTAERDALKIRLERTYCAFCGQEFILDDEAASMVSEHIRTCEKHPMRQVEAEVERLREVLTETKWRLDGTRTDELQAKYSSRREAALDCIRAALEVHDV